MTRPSTLASLPAVIAAAMIGAMPAGATSLDCTLTAEKAIVMLAEPIWLRLKCLNASDKPVRLDFANDWASGVAWRISPEVGEPPCQAAEAQIDANRVTLRLTNVSQQPLSFVLARSPFGTLFFMALTITQPDGTRLVRTIPDEPDETFMPGDHSLGPGGSVAFSQVLNEWHDFREVGEYTVVASIPITPKGQFISRSDPAATTTFTIRIGPRNAESLKETCTRLAARRARGDRKQSRPGMRCALSRRRNACRGLGGPCFTS